MKLLNSLPSVIDKEQRKNLRNFILKQTNLKTVVWEDVLDDKLQDLDYINLTRIPYTQELSIPAMEKQLEDIFVSTLAITKEDALIKNILAVHEMIRKDEVKSKNDVVQRTIDVLSGGNENTQQVNVEIKNNILALIPNTTEYYQPSSITVEYYPAFLEYILANTPESSLSSGTIAGYWHAEIYTNIKTTVGAIVTLDYESVIDFSNINLRGSSKYPLQLEKLEYYDAEGDDWVDITPVDLSYQKDFYMIFPETYLAKKIRMHVIQPHYDYIWSVNVSDAYVMRDFIISGRDITLIKNNRIDAVLQGQDAELVSYKALSNKYRYEIGAYNIQVFRKSYINSDGIFRTKRFYVNDVINDVKVSAVEIKPATGTGEYAAIDYNVIQMDESSVPITALDTKVPITKTFYKIEKFTTLQYNKVPLSYHPYIDLPNYDMVALVDAIAADRVDDFTYGNNVEYIVSGKNLFFNRNLTGSIVTVKYYHKTSNVVLEVRMNTNKDGLAFYTPEVKKLNIEINGERQL